MTKRLALILGITIVLVWLVAFWIGAHQSWIGEQPGTANYVHKTIGLLTDLPHSTVEIFWSLAENVLVFSVLWAFGKNRLHRQIDAEHGYHHDKDGDVHKLTEDCETE